MTRPSGIAVLFCAPLALLAQGDKDLRAQADALFAKGRYAEAFPSYQTLMGNALEDFDLNFRYGVCALHSSVDKDEVVKYLKRSTMGPKPPVLAWYFLGRAYHLNYHFKEALVAYDRFRGTADHKILLEYPVDALELQCRNGQNLLNDLKEIDVRSKVEVDGAEFFRFYDLSSVGGKIVVTPDELMSSADKKSGVRSLIYLPDKGGPIYFASYGKSSGTGRDIYRTELLPTGDFATPTRLAGYINTDQDEDFPFMAPDGKTFYFCSKGHNSMGGYDVFKSTYDKGLDVFGAPVNMDFAVNTPDDDMLYLTDPEGKEACFASNRNSRQGMVHVYRVSTTQTPVNISVLKGTFASDFDASDRKAHIVVQDVLSQETVADVRTDQNGTYVLALPRTGRYRFMVQAGPSGKTHVGMVEVPRNDEPRAYRQEMSLVDQGGEKLVIRNYFDAPLDEDLVALALDEIKRRARLDVGSHAQVADVPAPEKAGDDPFTRAGFAGDVTDKNVMEMASADAQEQAQHVEELDQRSKAAYSIALENAALAESHAANAEELVTRAQATSNEQERNTLMTDAARQRRAARAAGQRATAAYRTGEDLGTERLGASLKAAKAGKLRQDLATLLAGSDNNAKVIKLVELKARMDEKNSPDGSITVEEKMRRASTDREREAAALLQRANAARGDENELADRVARKKREESEAKGGRKQTIARERAELEAQLQAMHNENEQAFAKAKAAEKETSTARGQAALAKYLSTEAADMPVTELDNEQVKRMAGRIESAGSRMERLALDERFDAAIASETREAEQRTFNWGAPLEQATGEQATASVGTPRVKADGAASDRHAGERATKDGQAVSGNNAATGDQVAATSQADHSADATSAAGTTDQRANVPPVQAATDTVHGDMTAGAPQRAHDERPAGSGDRNSTGTTTRGDDHSGTARTNVDLASIRGVGTTDSSSAGDIDNSREADGRVMENTARSDRSKTSDGTTTEELSFVQANELAELMQIRSAEKNKTRRDSLDRRIADLQQAMHSTAKENAPTEGSRGQLAEENRAQGNSGDPAATNTRQVRTDAGTSAGSAAGTQFAADNLSASQPPIEFAPSATDEQLITEVYQDYGTSRERIARDVVDPDEQSTSLHGLELMLVDSIDAENARQLKYLDHHADDAAVVLKRINRLRDLRETHIKLAGEALSQADHQYAAQESRALEDAALARSGAGDGRVAGSDTEIPASTTPHNDSYVAIADDPEQVYTSVMEHRAAKADQAVHDRDRDMALLTGLEDRIDSLEGILENMPRGRSYDKLRQSTDRLIDDRLIMRTEIGQRMEYISRTEYAAAVDSAKRLTVATSKLGLSPAEPQVMMAQGMESDAKRGMEQAARMRKAADRSEDIVKRDSLFRLAYTQELGALREMDRALTVRNHMLGDDFRRGEKLTYEEVEVKMFGRTERPVARRDTPSRDVAMVADSTKGSAADAAKGSAPAATAGDPRSQGRNYEFIQSDPAAHGVIELPVEDAASLHAEALRAAQLSKELETRSVATADEANARQDSVAGAGRGDRGRLERQATRLRQISDSLHQASLLAAERADQLDKRSEEVGESTAFTKRLMTYYYLDDQEQALVMNEEDRSKYFRAKARAIEQREEAVQAMERSSGSRQLADTLLKHSSAILANKDGNAPLTNDQMAQASQLTDQAARLLQRADSLQNASERLNAAASVNEAQAASILQGLAPDRATEIMAMEQRTRRVETVLAEARSMQPAAARPVKGSATSVTTDVSAQRSAAGGGDAEQVAQSTGAGQLNTQASAPGAVTEPSTTRNTAGSPATGAGEAMTPGMLAPLAADMFLLNTDGSPRTGPIPMDQPMPQGVVFKVQVGAFRHEVPQDLFVNMAPLTGESVGNGLTRYTAGMFTTAQSAVRATEQVRQLGYRDAFVVAYEDGRRIPLAQAVRAARPAEAGAMASGTPARPPAEIHVIKNAFSITPAVADSMASADADVLANYPASAEAVLAQFAPPANVAAYYNDPKAAPARQVETVKGLFYTVQVGVYSKPTALDKLFNITPLNSERTENAKIRYTTGVFIDMDNARARKDETVMLGVKDAFITAYLNGKRIPIRDARALIARFGRAVFADPAILTR